MHHLLTEDLGADFYAWRAEIAGRQVCMATPRVYSDATARRIARDLIKRRGGDCASCRGCVIGRQD